MKQNILTFDDVKRESCFFNRAAGAPLRPKIKLKNKDPYRTRNAQRVINCEI